LIVAVLFCGCAKKADHREGRVVDVQSLVRFYKSVENARKIPPPERQSQARFLKEMYVPAYEKFGRKDAKWDKQAMAYLALFGNAEGREIPRDERIRLTRELLTLGCEDPLVRYRMTLDRYQPREANEEATNLWVEVTYDFDQTEYPIYWKFFSRLRACQAMKAEARRTRTRPAIVQELANVAYERLTELLKNHSVPTEVMSHAVSECILQDLNAVPGSGKWASERIEPLLIDGWGDTADAWYAIGLCRYQYAWDERGADWAKNVSDEGWRAMATHLPIARMALEKSWEIKPSEQTALQMIRLELGDSRGRDEMETWFNRAMWMNPESYDACDAKLYWLQPKWYGSAGEALEFGRQCLTNTAWKGRVPLILQEAHRLLAIWHEQSGTGPEAEYWLRPGVWEEVKASFERFFELNPLETGWRHNYALAAYKCRAWEDLRTQLRLLGTINYAYFGGKEAFEKMVREAEVNQ
jgi:hypothetical protein